jgi:hypothetical protein
VKSIVIRSKHGIARADRRSELGRDVAYVVRWELENGQGNSITYPIHGDGSEARAFAWRACIDASEGRPPRPITLSSWPAVRLARRAS